MKRTGAISMILAMAACARGVEPVVPDGDDGEADARRRIADGNAELARLDEAGWDEDSCEALDAHYAAIRLPNRRSASGQPIGPNPQRARRLGARVAYMRGLVAERCGDPEGARERYRQAMAQQPELCLPQVALAAEVEPRDPTQARLFLEQALDRNPRCREAYLALGRLQRLRFRELPEAVTNLRRALAIEADDPRTLVELAQVYWDWGRREPERLALAAVICRQAQLVAPDYAPLYNTWGLVDVARGDLTGASAMLTKARGLDPEYFEAHMNFGQLTLSQRAYEDAASAFRSARRLRPESYDAAIGLGVALRGLGRAEEAEARYRAAIAIDDARAEAYFDLAVLYQEHRSGSVADLERADAMLRAFVRRARAGSSHEETLRAVLRWCEGSTRDCRPGRAQNIHDTLVALGERPEGVRPDWTL
jgi:tetratricopeptide (TPR) repeat protein